MHLNYFTIIISVQGRYLMCNAVLVKDDSDWSEVKSQKKKIVV